MGHKMPEYMNIKEANDLSKEIVNIMKMSKDDEYEYYKIRDLDDLEKTCFVEEHLISPKLYGSILSGAFLLSKNRRTTILLNEEDHLRIQTIYKGLNLKQAYAEASKTDDFLEEQLEYSFHEKFGYITSCPTNIGTGLRASVMLHLPAISITNNIEELVNILRKLGLTLRGMYGEGTQSIGAIYQISNQKTLGIREEDILDRLNKVIAQVIDRENEMRAFLLNERKIDIEDKILRSYGLITNNKKIGFNEAMNYLSDIKLGMGLGVIDQVDGLDINKLMLEIQPAKIQCKLGVRMDKRAREIARSEYIIKTLTKEE